VLLQGDYTGALPIPARLKIMCCPVETICEVLCQNEAHVARDDFEKTIKNDLQGKRLYSEFESNLCNIIIASLNEVVFMKICCVLICLNRISIQNKCK